MTSFLLSHFRRSGWPVKPFLESLLKVPGNIYIYIYIYIIHVLLSESTPTHTIVINITVHSQNELEDMEEELTCCVLFLHTHNSLHYYGGGGGELCTVDCFSSPRSIIHCSTAISSFLTYIAWFDVSKSLHIVRCTLAYMKFCKIKSWDVVK
jgi:hypothetical protein